MALTCFDPSIYSVAQQNSTATIVMAGIADLLPAKDAGLFKTPS
jgi:hypothetical protein